MAPLQPGRVIDRYSLVSRLGEGGMAEVYRVRHVDLDSDHALKVLTVRSRKVGERLRAEGKAQARLRHPNIVKVTDLVEVDGAPGLVMELVEGPALDELLRGPTLDLETVDHLARGVLAGVAEAHRHGLVHRDLKPGNILVERGPGGLVPKIADFGLVKALEPGDSDPGRTRAGSTLGTPSYMSPEQIRDASAVDARTDIWSLGVILYELATGRLPFEGSDNLDLFTRISAGACPAPESLRPDLPPRMGRAIRAALEPALDARCPDCELLLDLWTGAVEGWAGGGGWGAAPTLEELLRAQREAADRDPPARPLRDAGRTLSPESDPSLSDPGRHTPDTLYDGPEAAQAERPPSLVDGGRLGLAAVGLALLGAVGLGGLLLLASGILAGGVLTRGGDEAVVDHAPPHATEEPAVPARADEVGAAAATETPPEAAVAGAPDTPAPSGPPPPAVAPSRTTRASPATAPATTASEAGGPEPEAPGAEAETGSPPELPATGTVEARGGVRVWLVGPSGRHTPGAVPPGRYTLMAFFDPLDPVEAGEVVVAAGATTTVSCSAAMTLCSVAGP